MFKNKAFQVKVVNETNSPIAAVPQVDLDMVDAKVKEYATSAAVGIVGMYAAMRIIYTATEIIIRRAT